MTQIVDEWSAIYGTWVAQRQVSRQATKVGVQKKIRIPKIKRAATQNHKLNKVYPGSYPGSRDAMGGGSKPTTAPQRVDLVSSSGAVASTSYSFANARLNLGSSSSSSSSGSSSDSDGSGHLRNTSGPQVLVIRPDTMEKGRGSINAGTGTSNDPAPLGSSADGTPGGQFSDYQNDMAVSRGSLDNSVAGTGGGGAPLVAPTPMASTLQPTNFKGEFVAVRPSLTP